MVNTGRPEADWEWGVRGGGAPPTGRPEADWEWGVRGGGAPPTCKQNALYYYYYYYFVGPIFKDAHKQQ